MPKIAISYRRSDSLDITGRIFDRLALRYGRNTVFRDIDNIRPGTDFRDQISEALEATDVLLAIVGPKWLGRGKGADSRIDNEADLVRIEVETALERKIPVIPVLVGGAKMPATSQLPESIRQFAFRQAVPVDGGRDFDHHVEGLVRSLDVILNPGRIPADRSSSPEKTLTGAQRYALWGGIGGLAVILAGAVFFFEHGTVPSQPAPTPSGLTTDLPAKPTTEPGKAVPPQVNPAILLSPGGKKRNPIDGMPFTLGDSYADFKEFYKTAPVPTKAQTGSYTTVKLNGIDVEFFFNTDQKLYQMRFGPRFKGSVFGISIGDSRGAVIQALGQPARVRGANRTKPSEIAYDNPDLVSVAFQITFFGKVNGFWLFDDNIEPMSGFEKYVPPPPPPLVGSPEPAQGDRAKALERVAMVAPPMPVTFGDTYELIKAIYKTSQEPTPYEGQGKTQLQLGELGLWFFFDVSGKIVVIRLDAPFAGSVAGIEIGDTRDKVEQLLGKPSVPIKNSRDYRYGTLRFQFDRSGKLVTIFL